jgi:hypothetical protein
MQAINLFLEEQKRCFAWFQEPELNNTITCIGFVSDDIQPSMVDSYIQTILSHANPEIKTQFDFNKVISELKLA